MVQALPLLLPRFPGPEVEKHWTSSFLRSPPITDCHFKVLTGITKENQAQPEKAFVNMRCTVAYYGKGWIYKDGGILFMLGDWAINQGCECAF